MFDQKLSRRRFLLGTSAVTAGALLAACVAPTAQPAAESSSSGEAAAPSSEPVTILFHSRLGSHADWHKSRVALFEEQNPGIKLQIDELDAGEMIAKIYAFAAGGNLGDIVWTYLNTVTAVCLLYTSRCV